MGSQLLFFRSPSAGRENSPQINMWRFCSPVLVEVGMVKPSQLVKPVTQVSGKILRTQHTELPRLPLPPLRQTLDRYLRVLEPALEEDELRRSKALVEEFQKAGGVGERLQRGLEWRERNTDNWLTDDYLTTVFLNIRNPLVIFSNPGVIYPPLDRDGEMGQIRCAVKTIAAKLDFKTRIDSGSAPVGFLGGKLLCMKQCEQLMSTCRLPGVTSDSLVFYNLSANPPKHITVVRNGQFFKLDVFNRDGSRLTVDQLCGQLERICNRSQGTNTAPVGILTTQSRDVWGKTYLNLIKDETNRTSVWTIESSIFTVCLDGAMAPGTYGKYLQMLHGGGSQWNSGNRWFDKSLQVIVAEDGTCGVNISHAVVDGTAALTVCDYCVEIMEKPDTMPSSSETLSTPQKLEFNITPEIQEDIEEAKQQMDTLTQNLDLTTSEFNHYGKEVLKAHKMSPNAFVQMAIQLAYYRIHHRCCPTLEPISLRMFSMGRLATINSNTTTSVAFVAAFDDPDVQNSRKLDLMKTAVEAHKKHMMMGSRGESVRPHLLMLKKQAVSEKMSMPGIFTDTSFTKVFDFKIVTSQVASKNGCLPFMAPEEPDAYSVCYRIENDHIGFIVFYFDASKTCRENKAEKLTQTLEEAMMDMRTLLEPGL